MKFELTNESKEVGGKKLFRIKALKDFGNVKKGDLGGFVEKLKNLSQDGDCWVRDNAQVYDNAQVCGNSKVCGNSRVYDNAWVYDSARVYGNARVFGNALVYGDALVSDNAQVYDKSWVSGNAHVFGDALVYQNMRVSFSQCTTDLSKDLRSSIRCQCNMIVSNKGLFVAYKHVREDLSSLYDPSFKYEVDKIAKVKNPDLSPERSCTSGLHVSHGSYWEGNDGKAVLTCLCRLQDVISVQEGKIRVKQLKVLDSADTEF